MPRYSQREQELALFFLQGRHGQCALGFYCGYSPQEVAHFLVYSTIRSDKKVGAKLLFSLPYWAEWQALRSRSNLAWPVNPTVQDLKDGHEAVTRRILANRMGDAKTESWEGLFAVTDALGNKRNDGLDFTTFYQDVVEATFQLAERCQLTVGDRDGYLHGRPVALRRLVYPQN